MVGECVERLNSVVLQVASEDRWNGYLHSSHGYTVSSAYDKLTEGLHNNATPNSQVLWLKVVPIKVSIFTWRLGLHRIPTKDNLFKIRFLTEVEQGCSTNYGLTKDRDPLFFQYGFYGKLGQLTSCRLGFSLQLSTKI